MLLIFTSNLLREISPAYIVNSWTKTVAKAPIYKFSRVATNACGEKAVQNKLRGHTLSLLYKCMDLTGRAAVKLQVLLSSMISIERELHNMDGESTSNITTYLQSYFGYTCQNTLRYIHPQRL